MREERGFKPDPRDLPGVQPHPQDIRFNHTPGITFSMTLDDSKGLKNESEYITEWVLKLCATPKAIALVAAGEGFGFSARVIANYIGEQFAEYQDADGDVVEIPYLGICLPFHARVIDLQLKRVAPGAAGLLEMTAAIVPGRVAMTYPRRNITVPAGVPHTVDVKFVVFAQRFSIDGNLVAGDTIDQRNGGGSVLLITLTAAMITTGWLGIHPQATFVRIGAAAARFAVLCMEVIA